MSFCCLRSESGLLQSGLGPSDPRCEPRLLWGHLAAHIAARFAGLYRCAKLVMCCSLPGCEGLGYSVEVSSRRAAVVAWTSDDKLFAAMWYANSWSREQQADPEPASAAAPAGAQCGGQSPRARLASGRQAPVD